MYRKLEDVTLKNGERAELGVLAGPDAEWGPRVRHLLGHKGPPWGWQIEQNLSNPATGTEGYFYLLSKEGRPFANIMTVERAGIGVFGHVYTAPEERRKGAADLIHHHQMEDFRRRAGRALYLGTGYDTHPYRLYQKYGFAGAEPESGSMFYFAQGQEAFEREVFAPGPVAIETLAFKHWPQLPALAMCRHPACLRILGMGVLNVVSSEGGALDYLAALARGAKTHDARVAVSRASDLPVALAARAPDPRFGPHVELVDAFAAPGHAAQLPELLDALALDPARRQICLADSAWPEKGAQLERAGFRQEALLRRHLRSRAGAFLDVAIWSRG